MAGSASRTKSSAQTANRRTSRATRSPRSLDPSGLLLQQISDLGEERHVRRRGGSGSWGPELVDGLDGHEDRKRDDEEVENRLKERTVFDEHWLARRAGAE